MASDLPPKNHRFFVHKLIENQCRIHADRVGLIFKDQHLSYDRFNQGANRIAHLLATLNSTNNTVVVVSDPGLSQIQALVGILKAGKVYLPMDLELPEHRLNSYFSTVESEIFIISKNDLVTAKRRIDQLVSNWKYVIVIDGPHLNLIENEGGNIRENENLILPVTNPEFEFNEQDANYIFFTSGSTGEPKAVVGKHISLSHFLQWEQKELQSDTLVRGASLIKPMFDASLRDILLPLISGGVLCIPSAATTVDFNQLVRWLTNQMVTIIHSVPTFMRGLIQFLEDENSSQLGALENLLFSGEKLYARDVNPWLKRFAGKLNIYNLYGTTETTLIKSFHKLTEPIDQENTALPVGRGIANAKLLVANEGAICQIGQSGEVFIQSKYFSKGYLIHGRLDNSIFLEDTISGTSEPIYNTGDIGRYLPEGTLEILGRTDDQIKIRGVRASLTEIEANIRLIDAVEDAVVILKQADIGQPKLQAFYTSEAELDETEFRKGLTEYLPQTHIPDHVMYLDKMPVTPTGKVDKKALEQLEKAEDKILVEEHLTATESTIKKIWEQVLGQEQISKSVSFFELGGTSMKAIVAVSKLKAAFDTTITLRSLLQNATIEQLAVLVHGKQHKENTENNPSFIDAIEDQEFYDPTFSQRQFWILDRVNASSAYNICLAYTIKSPVNMGWIKKAIRPIIEANDIMRTVMIDVDGELKQRVIPAAEFPERLYFNHNEIEISDQDVQWLVNNEKDTLFDLSKYPLFRVKLSGKGNHFLLTFCIHHILCDDRSLEIILDTFNKNYQHLSKGEPVGYDKPKVQYKDFSAWQKRKSLGNAWKNAEAYWKQQFQEMPPQLKFRPVEEGFRRNDGIEKKYKHRFSPSEYEQMKNFCSDKQITPLMLMLTTVGIAFRQLKSIKDIVIGLPFFGRENQQLEMQLGSFVNALPVRLRLHDKVTVEQIIQQTKEQVVAAFDHKDYPFELIVSNLGLSGSDNASPLFKVAVVWQENSGFSEKREDGDLDMDTIVPQKSSTKSDLSFIFTDMGEFVVLEIEFDRSKFALTQVENIGQVFRESLNAIQKFPQQNVNEVSANYKESRIINTTEPLEVGSILQHIGQNRSKDNQVILVQRDLHITQGKLLEEAGTLASALEQKGVAAGDPIAVVLPRSIDWVKSMIAIWKLNAIYVPFDHRTPYKRLEQQLIELNPKAVISRSEVADIQQVDKLMNLNSVDLKSLTPLEQLEPPSLDALAYIIHTSGSSGKPKGVKIDHGSISSLIVEQNIAFDIGQQDRMSQITSASFDVSITEVLMALFRGIPLILMEDELLYSTTQLKREIDRKSVTVLTIPPPLLNALNHYPLSTVRTIITGAESPIVKDVRFYQKTHKFINAYGPSEITVCASFGILKDIDLYGSPIGKPLPGQEILLLNENMQVIPLGEEGQIYVGGTRLAHGYLNNPLLTEQKFVKNPFEPSTRLYATGDIGYINLHGDLVYVGRIDDQVKISGIRVEPDEVRNTILRLPNISNAYVLAAQEGLDKYLNAYYTGTLAEESLMEYLAEVLPVHLVPREVLRLDEIPLTANGKVDREKLPTSIRRAQSEEGLGDHVHSEIAALWKKHLPDASARQGENFFRAGGSSLMAIRMLSGVEEAFEVSLDVKAFFQNPTPGNLERMIHLNAIRETGPQPTEDQHHYPTSHAQKSMWVVSQQAEGFEYNISSVYRVSEELDLLILEKAILLIVERHEMLLYNFFNLAGEIRQFKRTDAKCCIQHIKSPVDHAQQEIIADRERKHVFDLQHDTLLRIIFLKGENGEDIMIMTVHHIVTDGWSMARLKNELFEVYNLLIKRLPYTNPAVAATYKDYAVWHNLLDFKSEKAYWREQLDGLAMTLDYPIDNNGFSEGNEVVVIAKEDFTRLNEIALNTQTSLSSIILALFGLSLSMASGQHSFLIGISYANRKFTLLEDVVGFFINILPISIQIDPEVEFELFLTQVHDNVLDAITNSNLPYDKMLSLLDREKEQLNVYFNYESLFLTGKSKLEDLFDELNFQNETIAKSDMKLNAKETQDQVFLTMEYGSQAYSVGSRFKTFFNAILRNVIEKELTLEA